MPDKLQKMIDNRKQLHHLRLFTIFFAKIGGMSPVGRIFFEVPGTSQVPGTWLPQSDG
jgi:hypothetical protein